MVVTYGWKSSSLKSLADQCDRKDRDGRRLHEGKTIWIDVLMTKQFNTGEEILNSEKVVKITVDTCSAAFEHLVVADMDPGGGSILDRAWCQAELATTTSTDGIIITVVGDWGAAKDRLEVTGNDFFACLCVQSSVKGALVYAYSSI